MASRHLRGSGLRGHELEGFRHVQYRGGTSDNYAHRSIDEHRLGTSNRGVVQYAREYIRSDGHDATREYSNAIAKCHPTANCDQHFTPDCFAAGQCNPRTSADLHRNANRNLRTGPQSIDGRDSNCESHGDTDYYSKRLSDAVCHRQRDSRTYGDGYAIF